MFLDKMLIPLFLCLTVGTLVSAWTHRRRHGTCTEPSNTKLDFDDRLHDSFYQIPPLVGTVANLSSIPERFQNIRRTNLTGEPRCPSWAEAILHHDGNVCPFHYVLNFDDNRQPNTMVETECNCRECLSSADGPSLLLDCQPIVYYTKVFRRSGCNENNVYVYQPIWEPLEVGCRCGHAPSRAGRDDQLRPMQ